MKILRVTGAVISSVVGMVVLYLVIVIFGPGFTVIGQPLPVSRSTKDDKKKKHPKSREDISFEVDGSNVRGWLYLPEDMSVPVPCIIMNHGFGGTKDMILEPYAMRFQEAGIAVLSYDYRHFGESEGEPRQLFAIQHQLEDCLAAIDYVRSLKGIDGGRLALWGTSAGGGYGLVIAAQDRRIACVCAQCAGLDTKTDGELALKRDGLGHFLRLFVHAQRDKGRSRFGLSPHKIPIVGVPGSLAMITAPGAFEGYSSIATAAFINEVCARVLLTTAGFNPIDHAQDVECPVLLQVCDYDNLVSVSSALKTAELLGERTELKRYAIKHFDIYGGEHFERAVKDQLAFFQRYL